MSNLSEGKMIIALKGYIGAGKSTISKLIEKEYNFKTINVDNIVKQLYEQDDELKNKIVDEFGMEKFDKKELSEIVFSNKEQLRKLERIIHPILEKEIEKEIQNAKEDILLDCQIIDKLNIDYDYEILITCPKEEIIRRVKKRDNRDEVNIQNILNEQENYFLQKKKVFPINGKSDKEQLTKDLSKIIKIFKNDYKYKDLEGEYDEENW